MITIIDYKMGNVHSVQNALRSLGFASQIANDPGTIENASFLILPGVGAAGEAMNNLRQYNLIPSLTKCIENKTPLLGICLGMQILFEYSEENDTPCLGFIKGTVKKFSHDIGEKIPHVGWNTVTMKKLYAPYTGYYYFVHSYYCNPQENISTGTTAYGHPFTSMIQKDNIIACQFHPEKSGAQGLYLLKEIMQNFV